MDEFTPNRDFALTEHLLIDAPPETTYAAVGRLRGSALPYWSRPDEMVPAFEEILLRGKWVLLGERPGRELVFGAAGRFWTRFLKWHDITPQEFATYRRPRSGTIALALSVRPYQREQSLLTLETRVTVRDLVSRPWAEKYWHTTRAPAGLVARQILHAVNDRATGGRPQE